MNSLNTHFPSAVRSAKWLAWYTVLTSDTPNREDNSPAVISRESADHVDYGVVVLNGLTAHGVTV